MRLKYDMNVGALYVRLADAPVARTREINDNTMVDLDANGEVIGIEVVSMTHPWPLDEILSDYAIPPDEEAQLRAYFRSPLAPAASDASEQHAAPGTVTPEVSIDRSAPVRVPA